MNPQLTQKFYSVSELTEKIKRILEENFPMIWIYGEISNLRIPTSGHAYFTLKDHTAQIAAVMFKGQLRNLKFRLEDGFTISGLGRISLYEPRGTYQIILEYAEPKGVGALQIAFEQLKRKLGQEGLFDQVYKKPLPFLPECISVITSPTGAVIQDILNVLQRRFPGIRVEICPVRVQGVSAADEIVHAIELVNKRASSDVMIIARGGGSIEDLAPFNSEMVARAIFNSNIPVVSAVGHETDYTIADFVADLRAPTPSAAAELVAPSKSALQARCVELQQRAIHALSKLIAHYRGELGHLRRALVHPSKRVQDLQLRIDDLSDHLNRMMRIYLRRQGAHIGQIQNRLFFHNPKNRIDSLKLKVDILKSKLLELINNYFFNLKQRVSVSHAALVALSPQSVLERGYSIARTVPGKVVVTSAEHVRKGQRLELLLARGKIEVITD